MDTQDTQRRKSKKRLIIDMWIANPDYSLKHIASLIGCSYGYVRKVLSIFRRSQVTSKARPIIPISMHGRYYLNEVPPEWYDRVPVSPSCNRNKQKVYRGKFIKVVWHKSGSVFVYPLFPDREGEWRGELREWLKSFLPEDVVELFMSSLICKGRREIAAWIPRGFLPRGMKFRIKHLGTFEVDKTPYHDTLEFKVDPDLLKLDDQLRRLSYAVMQLLKQNLEYYHRQEKLEKLLEGFAEQLKLHLEVLQKISIAFERFNELLKENIERFQIKK